VISARYLICLSVAATALAVGSGCGAAASSRHGAASTRVSHEQAGGDSQVVSASLGPIPQDFATSVNPGADEWVNVNITGADPAELAVARWQAALQVADYSAESESGAGTSQVGGYTFQVVDGSGTAVNGPDSQEMFIIGRRISFTPSQDSQSEIDNEITAAAETEGLSVQSIKFLAGPNGLVAPQVVLSTTDAQSFETANPQVDSILDPDVYKWCGYVVEVVDGAGSPIVVNGSVPEIGRGVGWASNDANYPQESVIRQLNAANGKN